jgi:CHAD domain-containing protein
LHRDDREALHDLRVALRRTRSVLRTAKALLDEAAVDRLRTALRWLAGELSPARDLDVLAEHVESRASERGEDASEVTALFATDRDRAQARLVEALQSTRFLDLLDALRKTIGESSGRASEVTIEALAAREFARLERSASALGAESSDEAIHRARIRAKRARYAAELAEGTVGAPARKVVSAAKRFQEVLGQHQDAVVAEELLRNAAVQSTSGPAAFAAGRMAEHQRERRRGARDSLSDAWKKLRRRGRNAWA